MTLSFHPEARIDLIEAVRYYENKSLWLGNAFLDEVEKILQIIEHSPKLGRPFSNSTRKKLLKRFPYGIVYSIINDTDIKILAIMHLKRSPDYWKHRL